ncbi:hypothetical protein C8F01DRAFT_1118908 [Mycena amicta]|nr:hypothetical protein C8F01DRAFT_1118908 [Mycena amicta]
MTCALALVSYPRLVAVRVRVLLNVGADGFVWQCAGRWRECEKDFYRVRMSSQNAWRSSCTSSAFPADTASGSALRRSELVPSWPTMRLRGLESSYTALIRGCRCGRAGFQDRRTAVGGSRRAPWARGTWPLKSSGVFQRASGGQFGFIH